MSDRAPCTLSPLQRRARRRTQIARLRAYAAAAEFPHNYYRRRAVPVFVDPEQRHCAVAALMARDGYTAEVASIAATDVYVNLSELSAPPAAMAAWLEQSGLSLAEAARIQPSYWWRERDEQLSRRFALSCDADAIDAILSANDYDPANAAGCNPSLIECTALSFSAALAPSEQRLAFERQRLRAHFDAVIAELEAASETQDPAAGVAALDAATGAAAAVVSEEDEGGLLGVPAQPRWNFSAAEASASALAASLRRAVAAAAADSRGNSSSIVAGRTLEAALHAQLARGDAAGRERVARLACSVIPFLPRYHGGADVLWAGREDTELVGGITAAPLLLHRALEEELEHLNISYERMSELVAASPSKAAFPSNSPVLDGVLASLHACHARLFPSHSLVLATCRTCPLVGLREHRWGFARQPDATPHVRTAEHPAAAGPQAAYRALALLHPPIVDARELHRYSEQVPDASLLASYPALQRGLRHPWHRTDPLVGVDVSEAAAAGQNGGTRVVQWEKACYKAAVTVQPQQQQPPLLPHPWSEEGMGGIYVPPWPVDVSAVNRAWLSNLEARVAAASASRSAAAEAYHNRHHHQRHNGWSYDLPAYHDSWYHRYGYGYNDPFLTWTAAVLIIPLVVLISWAVAAMNRAASGGGGGGGYRFQRRY